MDDGLGRRSGMTAQDDGQRRLSGMRTIFKMVILEKSPILKQMILEKSAILKNGDIGDIGGP